MKRIIDLTFDIFDNAPAYPSDPETSIVTHSTIGRDSFNVSRISMSSHLGTHLDAPFHFFSDGKTVAEIPPEKLMGPALVLDFSSKGEGDKITLGEIKKFGSGIIKNPILIIRTGWDKVYPSEKYFWNHPSVSPDACGFIADCGVSCLACDMPGINSREIEETHKLLLGRGIILVECLCGLGKLKSPEVLFIALPLKITGADGSPCRALAVEGLSSDEAEIFNFLSL